MKTTLLLVIALLLGTITAFAQDYIYLKNGDKIEAIVNETTKTATLYFEFGDSSRELKLIDNTNIKLIAYSNGKVKDFTDGSSMKTNDGVNNNLIAYHLADLLINNFTISYERIFNNGLMGIQIPLSVGYSGYYQELGDFKNIFYTGVNFNIYPTGQGQWRYFLGPGIRLGSGTYEYDTYDYNGYHNYINEDLFYLKFHINNGVIFTPIPALSLAASLSLGIRYVDSKYSDEEVRTTGAASFNMIYRF